MRSSLAAAQLDLQECVSGFRLTGCRRHLTLTTVSETDPRRLILLVEDEPLLRELLAVSLETRGFQVVTAATAADGRRAFQRFDPDGLVLDIDLGAGPNGFDLAHSLRKQSPHLAIVFLTNMPDPRFSGRTSESLPAGIAYLRKSALADITALVDALDHVLKGLSVDRFRHDLDSSRPLDALTRKQMEVLRLVAEGDTNAQIAAKRGISLKAVEETLSRIFHALQLDAEGHGNSRVVATRLYLAAQRGMGLQETWASGPTR